MKKQGDSKTGKASFSTLQDTLLSCLGSLFAFLLVRWVSEPTYGFTGHLFIYLGGGFVFSLLGYLLSGLNKVVREESAARGSLRIVYTLIFKEIGQAILLISPLTGPLGPAIIVLAILADFVFSLGLLTYPRAIAAKIRKENRELGSLSSTLNALVMGCDREAVDMARWAEASGRYCVLGLLTGDPEWNGKVIDDYVVYCATNDDEMDKLQWRLGGVDCILIPKGRDTSVGAKAAAGGNAAAPPAVKDNMNAAGRLVKRSFDVLLSGVLLLAFSPLYALCALAVLLQDGRPVMYRQERIGRGGKPFGILKFRTMRTDAESEGPSLYAGDDDPRLTRVGRFLRIHHLDELPQLWNVLCGDMSFIGYRPERQYYIDQIMAVNPRYRYLYQIRPGVTSYATLYNGYTDTLEKMLRRLDLDLYYLRNHSVGFDVRILGLTFLSIVGGKKF